MAHGRPTVDFGSRCAVRRYVRHIHQVIVVTMTNEDCRRSICRSGKQPFNCVRIGGDSRRTAKQSSYSWPYLSERRVAEKRRCQQHVTLVLDQQSGNSEEGDGNDAGRIAAIRSFTSKPLRS